MITKLSDKEIQTVLELERYVEDLLIELKKMPASSTFNQIESVLAILKNKDADSFCKIKQKLISDLRMIYDNRLDNSELNKKADHAFKIVENNSIFQ